MTTTDAIQPELKTTLRRLKLGRLLDTLIGYAFFLAVFPRALVARWRIQSARRVSLDAIDRMLRRGMPG